MWLDKPEKAYDSLQPWARQNLERASKAVAVSLSLQGAEPDSLSDPSNTLIRPYHIYYIRYHEGILYYAILHDYTIR